MLAVRYQDCNTEKHLEAATTLERDISLHSDCAGGNTNIITILLERGADMFGKTDKGYIPFHTACQKGNFEVLKLFIFEVKKKVHSNRE